jgi:predicted  nucleic acid-binding Zn ribbon protein
MKNKCCPSCGAEIYDDEYMHDILGSIERKLDLISES